MDNLPTEIILQIMSYMYQLDVGNYIKLDIKYICYYIYVENKHICHYINHNIIREQCIDIINLSIVCKYFNNIVRENGMKVIYFDINVKIDIINKYKSKYIIAPNDKQLNDNQLKSLTNLTYIYLKKNKNITDDGINPLTNLTHLTLHCNENITDEGIKPLTNLTHLKLNFNKNITDEGIKPLTNLTYLIL